MLKIVINKFGIYAIISVFMIILSSCDSSTDSAVAPKTLKDDIYGNWKIYRTCIESNNSVSEVGVGNKDVQTWGFSHDGANSERLILYVGQNSVNGVWVPTTDIYPFPHWLLVLEVIDPTTNIKLVSVIEIGSINPLTGINTNMFENPDTKEFELINAFTLEGVRQ